MRIIRIHEFGPPDVLRVEQAAEPEPSAGRVVIAVELSGVAFGDTIVRSGRYPVPLPYEPGLEVGGRVAAVGPEADPGLVGRRVVATTTGNRGGYAQYALAESASVHEVPEGLALDRAVAVFQAGSFAAGLLEAVAPQAGDSVLITAAVGRIGTLLVQLAAARGARVIGAAGGERKLAAARETGAAVAVDYDRPDWADHVKAATDGRGVEVALDAIGGAIRDQALATLATGTGRIGVYGYTGDGPTTIDAMYLARRGLTVVGAAGKVFVRSAAEERAAVRAALDAAVSGLLRPTIHSVFPLEDVAAAHAELEQRRSVGAVLLAV
jgi:NADPH:quinone reductase